MDRWRVSGYETIELIRGVNVTQEYPRHWHDEIYVCATLAGSSYLEWCGTSLLTHRGTLALVGPGTIHANRKISCSFRCMLVESNGLKEGVEQLVERSITGLSFRNGLLENQRTIGMFLKVHRALEANRQDLDKDSLAMAFLYELAMRYGAVHLPMRRTGNEDFAVRRTKRFLDEHYSERVSLVELARLIGLSAYHLNRSFCQKVGMPPHAYQVQVRIMKAKSFLRLGRSIAETASLVGFVDQSHFTRHFKRYVGLTPGQFPR